MITRALKQVDLDHIKNLHHWAAKAAARGDHTSSERFQRAAHSTFERAVYEQRQQQENRDAV